MGSREVSLGRAGHMGTSCRRRRGGDAVRVTCFQTAAAPHYTPARRITTTKDGRSEARHPAPPSAAQPPSCPPPTAKLSTAKLSTAKPSAAQPARRPPPSCPPPAAHRQAIHRPAAQPSSRPAATQPPPARLTASVQLGQSTRAKGAQVHRSSTDPNRRTVADDCVHS